MPLSIHPSVFLIISLHDNLFHIANITRSGQRFCSVVLVLCNVRFSHLTYRQNDSHSFFLKTFTFFQHKFITLSRSLQSSRTHHITVSAYGHPYTVKYS